MNVMIFPTDDRSGQASLIFHYNKLGHKVFIPKNGTLGLNWKRIATWPALLCKASSDPTKRNIEIHGFERTDETLFGEDFFLSNEWPKLYNDDVTCELIDDSFSGKIDAFHTLRGGEAHLHRYFDIVFRKFPGAKWVSSTFNQNSSCPGGFEVKNAAKLIPAPYETHHKTVNNVCLMSTDFEARLLGVELGEVDENPTPAFASFNHNFANRQPADFGLFEDMNALLVQRGISPILNFGGNIRTQGADIRYTSDRGITGHFDTLTPAEAYATINTLLSTIHFKADDWGGGVFYYSMNANTPIITTQRYINASNSGRFLVHNENSLVVNTPQEAADAVLSLWHDRHLAARLRDGMQKMKQSIFSGNYWSDWESFLRGLV